MVDKMGDKTSFFVILFLGIFFFLISFVSATSFIGIPNYSINSVYGPGGNATGWVNISFSSEPTNSIFSDLYGNSANLSQVLSQNPEYIYSCSPSGCLDDYQAANPEQVKTLALIPGQSAIYGIKLTGNVSGVDSISFNLTSDATASCVNQISVDFLNDNSTDAINTNSGTQGSCSGLQNYGCFDSSQTMSQYGITATPYCELVNLSESPGFLLGAWLKKVSGSLAINASLNDMYGQQLSTCTLPDASLSGGEVSCNVNYSVTNPGQYYICIYATSGSGSYMTQGYADSNGCGFPENPPSTFTASYQIFAEGNQFGPTGTMALDQSMNNDVSFADLANQYLSQRYPNLDCTQGCILPINITSYANQDIVLSGLQAQYHNSAGLVVENNFYDLSSTAAKVSSDFQQLYIDGSGFSVPTSYGNYTFYLNLDNKNIVSQPIQVTDIPIITSVTPINTASVYPTNFTANINSSYNITGFYWDFGDNTSSISTGNMIMHSYDTIGVYKMTVTATDQRGETGSATFMINVSSPKNLIANNVNQLEDNLLVIENEMSSYPLFYQQAINKTLGLSAVNDTLNLISSEYQNATSDQDYYNIVSEMISLNLPSTITKTATSANIPFITNASNVNIGAVQGIDGESYDQTQQQGYINGVLEWDQSNITAMISFDQLSGLYSRTLSPIVNIFKISVVPNPDISSDYYLILPELQGFYTNAQYNDTGNYVYIDLKNQNPVYFSTTQTLDLTNLPFFISPPINQLSVTQTLPEQKTTSKWVIFGIIIGALLIIWAIVYVILAKWYQKKYENYLFKNKNDLYNMVIYVNNAKKKGMSNKEIEENLKKAGWSAERIVYVMKKYAGKRTGMFGFGTKRPVVGPGGQTGK